jgi:abortive infection bacteriophage resistance protein
VKFNKPPLSIPDQLKKLKARGLIVADDLVGESYLRTIGYYRLSAYALPFQQRTLPDKPFVAGTTLASVFDLYTFDRELRTLLLDALERIEIGFRSALNNYMCTTYDPHWYMDEGLFSSKERFDRFIQWVRDELGIPDGGTKPNRDHSEVFVNHYYNKYGDPYLPPAWMVGEMLPLGMWSKLYANLRNGADRQAVATAFGFNESVFGGMLHMLTYVRNLCAHHQRLWNRRFVIKAKIPNKYGAIIPAASSDRFYAAAVITLDLLRTVEAHTKWNHRLDELIRRHPCAGARTSEMGFPVFWRKDTFWDLRSPADDPLCHI